MVGECIFLAVGQCGNQLCWDFFDTIATEHDLLKKPHGYGLSQFFSEYTDITDNKTHYRARCLMMDTEEGVLNTLRRTHRIRGLFQPEFMVSDVSGTGNNWARGYYEFGDKFNHHIEDRTRKIMEGCESAHAFVMTHSMSGGSGSGLGSYLLEMLHDLYPAQKRVTLTMAPSAETDDVITAPYNSIMTANAIVQHADLTLVGDNQSLSDQITQGDSKAKLSNFSSLNSAAIRPLVNLTAPQRLGGSAPVTLPGLIYDICPRLHMPFVTHATIGAADGSSIAKVFRPKKWSLASYHDDETPSVFSGSLFSRGDMPSADSVRTAMEKIRSTRFTSDLMRYGLSRYDSPGLHETTAIFGSDLVANMLDTGILSKFDKMYKAKASVHLYTQAGMESAQFMAARDIVATCGAAYRE
ncbi:Tubulin [Carpediemonas membranifera]|uniref:Tubulin n=1 Tax=Carpediemonas membranifera TaxID=201153 RepID=A0A8J6E219_9EUKA|nr:Tubulin [Carpediemonas membranifera]|eukprot:KAG9391327.1 Tubulin [Carpediemonas membranifera]